MTAAHYKGGHPPGNDLGLHYTALPPIVASCPYSDQLLVTRKFWSPGANRPSQAKTPLNVKTAALRVAMAPLPLVKLGDEWGPGRDSMADRAPFLSTAHG